MMNKTNIPEGWEELDLGRVFCFLKTSSYSRSQTSKFSNNVLYIHYGDIHKINKFTLDFSKENISRLSDNIDSSSLDLLQNGDLIIADASEDYSGIGLCSEVKNLNEKAVSGLHTFALRPNRSFINIGFSSLLLSNFLVRNYLKKIATGASVLGITRTNLIKTPLLVPPLQEQEAIADILEKWDEAIEKTSKLIEAKKKRFEWLKYGLLKKISKKPETKSTPLGSLLDYEQPTKYIVKSTKYTASGLTAVLTANKSFILGYTNEKEGIFDKFPVIIFDDFTTDIKYVDFSFKVKSSAIKILISRNKEADIEYIFAAMSLIKIPLGGHKRYWISEYQFLNIPLPSLLRQKQIAKTLNTAAKEITILEGILAKYKSQKKGLMQKLLTGKIRVNNINSIN